MLTVHGPLRDEFSCLCPLGFEAKNDFDHKTFKIKSHSVRVLKRYLNDNSTIHSPETESIFRFSSENSEPYFKIEL